MLSHRQLPVVVAFLVVKDRALQRLHFGKGKKVPRALPGWVCGPGGGREALGVPGLISMLVTSSQDLSSAT